MTDIVFKEGISAVGKSKSNRDTQQRYSDDQQGSQLNQQRVAPAGPSAAERSGSEQQEGTQGQVGQGSCLSNTTTRSSNDVHQAAGLDKLEVLVGADFTEKYEQFITELRETHNEAREVGEEMMIEHGDWLVQVWPKCGFFYANTKFGLSVTVRGIRVHLTEKLTQSKKCYAAKVEIDSLKLMTSGHGLMWATARKFLQDIGLRINQTQVARLDVCADVDAGMREYSESIRGGQFIGGGNRKLSIYGTVGSDESVYVGKTSDKKVGCFVRIYSKTKEILNASMKDKRLAGEKYFACWSRMGLDPEAEFALFREVTRVEFQVRGSWIRAKFDQVSEVEDVFRALPAISAYLAGKWFRVVEQKPDTGGKNQSKIKLHTCWERVIEALKYGFGNTHQELTRATRDYAMRTAAESRKLAVRELVKAAAMSPYDFRNERDIVEYIQSEIAAHIPVDYKGMVAERRQKMIARGVVEKDFFNGEIVRGRIKRDEYDNILGTGLNQESQRGPEQTSLPF